MHRVLLADDSPHALRMGERILREEGFEVATAANGASALARVAETDPDVILADVFLPDTSGYQICEQVKSHPRFRHTRVVLTAGALEPLDEAEARRVQADAVLKKPFEASVVVETIKPLAEAAGMSRGLFAEEFQKMTGPPPHLALPAVSPSVAAALARAGTQIDPERVRAAVTLALDAALPAMIEEVTERVLVALGH
jgi:CheY-like chemotaxis protein